MVTHVGAAELQLAPTGIGRMLEQVPSVQVELLGQLWAVGHQVPDDPEQNLRHHPTSVLQFEVPV